MYDSSATQDQMEDYLRELELRQAKDIANAEEDLRAQKFMENLMADRAYLEAELYRLYLEDLANSNSPLNADKRASHKRPAAEEDAEYGAPEARTQPSTPKQPRPPKINIAEEVSKFYKKNRSSDSDAPENNKENNKQGPGSPKKG